jgi:alkylated DNA repair protein alkB family protein 1
MTRENKFRQKFKYYKQRVPAPVLADLVDPHNPLWDNSFTECSSQRVPAQSGGLRMTPPETWRLRSSRVSPGFHIVSGALAPEHQLYWAVRCLKDYSSPPSRRNIDAVCPEIGDWFAEAVAARGAGVTDKLRWATMGYHHNWDTKVNILCINTGEHSGRYFFVFRWISRRV